MRYIVTTLIFSMTVAAGAAEKFEGFWKKQDHSWLMTFDNHFVLKAQDAVKLTIVTEKRKPAATEAWNKKDFKAQMEKFTAGRLAFNEMVGISDWKLSDSKLNEANGSQWLTLEGTYKSVKGEPRHFHEIHRIEGTQAKIAAISYPSNISVSAVTPALQSIREKLEQP